MNFERGQERERVLSPQCAPYIAASALDRTTFPAYPTRARRVYGLVGADWRRTIAGCADGGTATRSGTLSATGRIYQCAIASEL